jgi:hypothetical protein
LHVKQWLSRGELWDDAPEKGRALQTLFRYVGVIVALGLAVYGLAVVGEVLRDHTPGDLHEGLAAAGAGLTTAAVIGLAAFRVPPFSISVDVWCARSRADSDLLLRRQCRMPHDRAIERVVLLQIPVSAAATIDHNRAWRHG